MQWLNLVVHTFILHNWLNFLKWTWSFFSTFCVSVLEDPIPYFIQISKLKSPGAFLEQQERTNYYLHGHGIEHTSKYRNIHKNNNNIIFRNARVGMWALKYWWFQTFILALLIHNRGYFHHCSLIPLKFFQRQRQRVLCTFFI